MTIISRVRYPDDNPPFSNERNLGAARAYLGSPGLGNGTLGSGTPDTLVSGVGEDRTYTSPSGSAGRSSEERSESTAGPSEEAVSVVDRVVTETVRCLIGLYTRFNADHGGTESEGVFCAALHGLFGVENTGNPIEMIKQVAKETAGSIASKILKEDEVTKIEVDRAQRLTCVADFDADVRRAIGNAFAQLRDALKSVVARDGSDRAMRGASHPNRVNSPRSTSAGA